MKEILTIQQVPPSLHKPMRDVGYTKARIVAANAPEGVVYELLPDDFGSEVPAPTGFPVMWGIKDGVATPVPNDRALELMPVAD